MPSDLSTYLALLKLVDDTAKDLRLSHLTASDRNVLLALTSFAGDNKEAEGFTYTRYCQNVGFTSWICVAIANDNIFDNKS